MNIRLAVILTIIGAVGAALSCRTDSQSTRQSPDSTQLTAEAAGPDDGRESAFDGRVVELDTVRLAAESPSEPSIDYDLPRGCHFTEDAPCQFTWTTTEHLTVGHATDSTGAVRQAVMPLVLTVAAGGSHGTLSLDAQLYFCEDGTKICQLDKVRIVLPVLRTTEAPARAAVTVDVATSDDL